MLRPDYYYYFNSLKTVAHSAKLVYKGPSIYKVNDKILQEKKKKKKYMFLKRSKLKSVCN